MDEEIADDTDVKFNNPISRGPSGDMPSFADVEPSTIQPDSLGGTEPIQPESLDALEVVTNIQGKENERDRRRRVAIQRLAESRVIDPNGGFRRKWDLVQMMLLTYVAFSVPYRLGFSHPVILWSGWFWFDFFVDLYFVADIFVSLTTAFWDENGELIVDFVNIRREYLRTWFAIDISSCFPGNYISYAMEGDGDGTTRIIKLLRMLRLLKLLRLARINRLMRKYEEEFASLLTTMKLGKLIIVIVVVGHWLSCIFFFAGEIDASTFEDINEYDPGLDPIGNETVGWVFRHFDSESCGPGECYQQKYLTSFYWAVMTMTTVGYGDIVPHTKYEVLACTIAMIIGGFIFGMIVGALAELSKRANAGELMRQEAVSRVQIILSSGVARGTVTPELCRRIKNYCSNLMERNTSLDINAFVLRLPPALRNQMAESMHWIDGERDGYPVYGMLHKIPFFTNVGTVGCIQICAKMNIVHMSPPTEDKQPVMLEGEVGEEMYIVVEGSKSVLLERKEETIGWLSSGDFFGELGALLPPEMKDQRVRRRSAWAIKDVQLGMITYDDLMQFRRENININEQVVAYTNTLLESMEERSIPVNKLTLLDCHPELSILDQKLEVLLNK